MNKYETLPPEILENIFKKLTGREVVSCRGVCRRWRGVIDAFTDCTWEYYCRRDFQNPQPVKNPANLSYKELYKSLTLWDKVEDAELRITNLPQLDTKVNRFHVFNNQLAIATDDRDYLWFMRDSTIDDFSNKIHYYNPATLEFVSCQSYPFLFKEYDENENMITLVDDNKRLHIIVKSNDQEKVYDLYKNSYCYGISPHAMISNTVYFLDINKVVCVAELQVVDGELTIETKELAQMTDSFTAIVAFVQSGCKTVNILGLVLTTVTGSAKVKFGLHVYCLWNNNLNLCGQIDNTTQNIISKLREFGFHLNELKLAEWLFNEKINQKMIARSIRPTTIHAHNDIILMGGLEKGTGEDNCLRCLHIFKKPYNVNGHLITYDQKPNRSLVLPDTLIYSGIRKLEVVEILNGHRVIVSADYKLLFCDLIHKQK